MKTLGLSLLLLFFGSAAPVAAAVPQVVVTIKPIHSLVAGVMARVGAPELLIEGAASPHDYHLRPSDARRLAAADLVVRVGAAFEAFLDRPLRTLAGQARVFSCAELDGILLLPARRGGIWGESDRGEADVTEHSRHATDNLHLWLDPHNAQVIVRQLVVTLSELDPADAAAYRRNGETLQRRLKKLDARLRQLLAPVREVPYLVFHDAYPYLEHRYGLHAVGTITVSADRPPGARRLSELRARLEGLGARCIFREPQFEPKLATMLVAGTEARIGVLDPLGADLNPGPDAYFTLLQQLAKNLRHCLLPAT